MEREMIRFFFLLIVTIQLTLSDAEQKSKLFQGKHLIVSLEHLPPGSVIERNSSGHVIGYSGALVSHFDWLSKTLGFEYTLIPWDNSTTAPIKSNVTRNAFGVMIRQLIRSEVDASLGPFVVRLERNDIGIGGLMGVALSMMLVRYPSVEKSIHATLEPFNYQIWLGILLSLLAIFCCSWLIIYISCRFLNPEIRMQETVIQIFVYFFKVILQQGTRYVRITRSIGVLAFTWVLIAIVIVNAYNSSVISYLSANYRKPEVSTFKELAENPKFNMISVKGSISEVEVATGVTKVLQAVALKYERCPECSMEYKPELLAKKVIEGNYVAVMSATACMALVDQFSLNQKECKLTMGNDRFKYYHIFFGVPKNSPYQEEMRKESLWYIAHGFTLPIKFEGRCLLEYNYKGVQAESVISPIKLKQLFIPFVILICGWLLAFFQFLRELMQAHFERQMMTNQVDPASVVNHQVLLESNDPDRSSHPEKGLVEIKSTSKHIPSPPSVEETKVVIEHHSLLKVDDISDNSDDDNTTTSPPYTKIKKIVEVNSLLVTEAEHSIEKPSLYTDDNINIHTEIGTVNKKGPVITFQTRGTFEYSQSQLNMIELSDDLNDN